MFYIAQRERGRDRELDKNYVGATVLWPRKSVLHCHTSLRKASFLLFLCIEKKATIQVVGHTETAAIVLLLGMYNLIALLTH